MTEALSQLKYIIFFATLIIGVPLGYYLSLRHPLVERIVFFLMIFFTARMEDINFVSRETFRLSSRGFEIGMVDIATIILFLLVLKRRKLYRPHLPPGSWIYFVYFAFSALSIVNSAVVLFSLFELWKMLRMFIFFWVVYNYVNDFGKFKDVLISSALVVIYIFGEVMYQKYGLGRFQSPGPFPHQNSLVMYSIMLGSLIFAYLLNIRDIKLMHFSLWSLFFAMISVSVISTLSRAGMVLYVLAMSITMGVSLISGLSQKKIVIMAVLLIMSLAILARAWNSISERFTTAPTESARVRQDLAKAALKMVQDKPLGIGLNNFGVKINPPWQYSSHIEMHDPENEEEQNGLVETIYLMIAAESGWHTLVAFLAFLLYYLILNIRNYFRYKHKELQYLSIAMMGALVAIYLESTLEWVLKQTNNFYQIMLFFALIAAMHKLAKRYRRQQLPLPNNARPSPQGSVF